MLTTLIYGSHILKSKKAVFARMMWNQNDSRKNLPKLGTLAVYLKQILTVQTGTPSKASERERRGGGRVQKITRLTFHEDKLSPESKLLQMPWVSERNRSAPK